MQSQVIETSAIELAFENDAAVEAWFISDEVRSHSHCGEPLRVEAPLHSTNVQDDQEPVECVDKLHQELARLQADNKYLREGDSQLSALLGLVPTSLKVAPSSTAAPRTRAMLELLPSLTPPSMHFAC